MFVFLSDMYHVQGLHAVATGQRVWEPPTFGGMGSCCIVARGRALNSTWLGFVRDLLVHQIVFASYGVQSDAAPLHCCDKSGKCRSSHKCMCKLRILANTTDRRSTTKKK